ncbi:MAG TPA: presqualene diphosphate synthase HpnD [Acidimicrobiales bacterium]|jgi:phytoene synthase|nr:presqualene diphosphate synthase HpnD [Acidimicrobiales bacterium]
MTDLALAYERCELITRTEARNFAYGIRLLPAPKRRAMSALYAFARRVDDIGDGAAPVADKLAALARVRGDLAALAAGVPPAGDDVLVALADAAQRYPIPLSALGELVTGCEMDCRLQRYETFDDLLVYCRCVAGSIGRLSLAVFGSSDPEAPRLADTLGAALQLTNILRDVVEDRELMGRVYLPAEDLDRFGCAPDASGPPAALVDLIRFEASRARSRYEEGLGLLDLLDRRSRACVAAMAGIYRRLLERIESDPLAVVDRRVSLPTWEKAWVAARSLAGVGA